MYFISTRGKEKVKAERAVLLGFAENGGLFVPEKFPQLDLNAMLETSYAERVAKVLAQFFDGLDETLLLSLCEKAYGAFEGTDPLPIVRIDEGKYILELYHGRTCAYEDLSLSLFPALFNECKKVCDDDANRLILMASSGDAGKATLEAFKDVDGVKVAVLYPDESISKLQRIALTVSSGKNVFVTGVKGGFDDCRKAVEKGYFSGELNGALADEGMKICTLSSANIARILPMIACFVSGYLDLLSSGQIEEGERVDFAVPAGNGSGVLAALYAKKMGVPIRKILSCSNRNRSMYELLKKGEADESRSFHHTMSASMDVVVPSNLERFVFEATERNAALTEEKVKKIKTGEIVVLTEEERKKLTADIYPGFASEDDTVESMYEVFEEYGYAMDTHTGVASAVCDKVLLKRDPKDETPIVVTAVTNPYKFPQDALYALSGNDVKDSFKGIKRLNLLTAMKPPKFLLDMRYKAPRFKGVVDARKALSEVVEFVHGKTVPEPTEK